MGHTEPLNISSPSPLGTSGVALEVPGLCQDHSLELVYMWTSLWLGFVLSIEV